MDMDGCIVYMKINNIYKDIAEDLERTFDSSNYELDSPLPKERTKKLSD